MIRRALSQDHLDARRRQILDAAAVCFARNGFHATSMPDLFAAAELSSGAVYRYFTSKDEIITALADRALRPVIDALQDAADAEPPPKVAEIVDLIHDKLRIESGSTEQASLVVQLWAEAVRNPTVRDSQRRSARALHEALRKLITRTSPAVTLNSSEAAWSLMALSMGTFLCQNFLQDTATPTDTLVAQLFTLLRAAAERPRPRRAGA